MIYCNDNVKIYEPLYENVEEGMLGRETRDNYFDVQLICCCCFLHVQAIRKMRCVCSAPIRCGGVFAMWNFLLHYTHRTN